ncbi:TPA_asm: hypothetical protein PROPHIFVLQ01-1_22 [Mycobacterium phage prophiFVLQ01-1]|nr:TPA_asm: hypothetical protein PROPHIFVLQ01-1_22 [Mycobacterium phage prophiFVLQ01-1]
MSAPAPACKCGHDDDTHVAGFGQCLGCTHCPDIPHNAKSGHVYARCLCTEFRRDDENASQTARLMGMTG